MERNSMSARKSREKRLRFFSKKNVNLQKRIEVVAPIYDKTIKKQLTEFLHLQLTDNTKASTLDERMSNIRKEPTEGTPSIRAQYDYKEFLFSTNEAIKSTVPSIPRTEELTQR